MDVRRASSSGGLQRLSMSGSAQGFQRRGSASGFSTSNSMRRNTIAALVGTNQSQSTRNYGLRYASMGGANSKANTNRGHHYRRMLQEKAQAKADGKDPDEIDNMERVAYQYQPENYDEYLNQISKKSEMAQKMSPVKQRIIQKIYGDVIVGKYYNVQMRGETGT